MSSSLLSEPEEIQQWSAAHEMGHVVLGHRLVDGLPTSLLWLALGLGTMVAAILSPPVPLVWVVWTVAAALVVINTGCILVGFRAFARQIRSSEIAADHFAQDQGYPVTASVAAWLAEAEPRLLLTRAYGPWRTHPMPTDRQR